ncbi:unnamed protein product [Cladocopium goreaui]|uniref:Subversion of eukaryotic traffic protein A (Effector protein SetA) (Subversion of eukaryotic vesicle trafficking A) n=1 Tax=Cladocopium goreaui TaxID=2562237 RepID=A0A9P1CF33_9DINO|nr:unnamed protein product [Cladocopium goreaui]
MATASSFSPFGHPRALEHRASLRSCIKGVPKILHFLWFCSPLPKHITKRIVDFALMNPTYKVMVLVDVAPNQSEVDFMNSPEVLKRPAGSIIVHYLKSYGEIFRTMDILRWMDNISHNPAHKHKCAGMSDVARLETLFHYGGIYMDTDFVPDRPFADYGDLFRWPFVTHKVLDVPLFVEIGGVILKNLGYHPDCRIYLHV